MHASRIARHGDPNVVNGPGPNGWSRVEFLARYIPDRPKGECWIWRGYVNSRGYGHITQTVEPGRQRPYKAHRYVYEMFVGPIPEGKMLRHSCDNPPCVNPDHLTPGDAADNAMDMAVRNRSTRGSKNASSLLTEDQVREIVRRCGSGERKKDVAATFGVSPSAVSGILHGRTWNHVTGLCQSRRGVRCYCSHPECSAYESYIDKSGVKPPDESETE